MEEIKEGGPAFPLVAQNWHHKGMTLRDYFAAKAMQMPRGDISAEWNARRAYEMADAMLKARNQ